jgi:hypothetical protein
LNNLEACGLAIGHLHYVGHMHSMRLKVDDLEDCIPDYICIMYIDIYIYESNIFVCIFHLWYMILFVFIIYVCIFAYYEILSYISISMYLHLCIFNYMRMYYEIYNYVCIHTNICVYFNIWIWFFILVFDRMHNVYVYIYICIYIFALYNPLVFPFNNEELHCIRHCGLHL